jgi:tetratricopeptide (TPR) repeat protein
LEIFREVLDVSARVGEVLMPPRTLNSIGWVHGELLNPGVALDWNERSAAAARELNLPDPEIECNARLNIADNLMALERLTEAAGQFAFVERVVTAPTPADRFMLWRYTQHYYHSYGELQFLRGDAETAAMLADKCLRLAEDTDTRKNIVKARRLRGQARMTLGDLSAAESDITAALELATELGNPGQLWKTYEALGDLRSAQRRDGDAKAVYAEALAVLDGMAESLTDDELRAPLLASTAVRRLHQLSSGG